MLQSLHGHAQLTLNASADARVLQAFRKKLKDSPEVLGLGGITLNDCILYAVSRSLPLHPGLNALWAGEKILRYARVHLAFAVDTPRGLMVPVIRCADTLSLKQISGEAKRLAKACVEGGITPDELSGGTFTVSNLGGLGVESFTPILNTPQVGILGVGNITPKPAASGEGVAFVPTLGLSLTIDHQAVDGAPGARFLKDLCEALAGFDILLAKG
jgi:pyruvate dehydrogenase E2 component (dihydrolipoamide acetyltransferase)